MVKAPGSSVGIATDCGLDGPGSNPGGDEIFRPSRPALGPTQPPVKWVPGLSRGVKCSRSVLLTTHPLLVPQSWKSRAIPLPTLWATPGLQWDHLTFFNGKGRPSTGPEVSRSVRIPDFKTVDM